MPDQYKINLVPEMTGEYAILIYKGSQKLGRLYAGSSEQEAKQTAKDLKEAFTNEGINDHT